jgi:phosphoesterase RecJ-like protein
MDCANIERGLTHWTPPAPVINIDHHAGNRRYGEINWIDPSAAATGEMLFQLVEHARLTLTPPMAEALLVALTTDTGSFRFSNTGPRQHRIAARLIEAGASVQRVARVAFGSHPIEGVRLTGHVLSNVRLECAGQLAWSEIRQDEYQKCGGEKNAPENLADALRSIRGVKLSVLFHELENGVLRVNFRSTGEHDVGQFAARWGGGGHRAAAGLSLTGAQFERDRDLILQAAMDLFASDGPLA